jgi:hypothetical protein
MLVVQLTEHVKSSPTPIAVTVDRRIVARVKMTLIKSTSHPLVILFGLALRYKVNGKL